MDMNAQKVKSIIGTNQRFRDPLCEPCSYYIWTLQDDYVVSDEDIQLYWQKLKYMSDNADILIQEAFNEELYNNNGVNRAYISSPDEMCRQLMVGSFVLNIKGRETGCCLSNEKFMKGHYIDCLWNDNWKLLYADFC